MVVKERQVLEHVHIVNERVQVYEELELTLHDEVNVGVLVVVLEQDLALNQVYRLQLENNSIDEVIVHLVLLKEVNLFENRLMGHLDYLLPKFVWNLPHQHLRLLEGSFKS